MSGMYAKRMTVPPFQIWAGNILPRKIYNLNAFSEDISTLLHNISITKNMNYRGIAVGNKVYTYDMAPSTHISVIRAEVLTYAEQVTLETILSRHEDVLKPFYLLSKKIERTVAKVMNRFDPRFAIYAIPSNKRRELITVYPILESGAIVTSIDPHYSLLLTPEEEKSNSKILEEIQEIVQPLHDEIAAEMFLSRII
tara:strand:+ start:12236 stop:12826 length:591 start_codon:yes stop_codon:yes gene_type:complete